MVRHVIGIIALLAMTACTTTTTTTSTSSAPPTSENTRLVPKIYRISSTGKSKVQLNMLDSVNAFRGSSGLQPLRLNSALIAAAATHSRDMSVQNRPWHFGSDGSSPIERVVRSGYAKTMLGENISETYETETETLTAWMGEPGTRAVILHPDGEDLGFAWYQETNGKIWWTLIVGGGGATTQVNAPNPFAELTDG